ncbi:MAG: hypothetical protein JEZ01_20695 [Labilibaculum sp.]|nr:hypothetical protein [Labilibaculum sp.]MBI9060199.1 hypothetical protein [Labilibaculum sp.]
MDYISKYTDEMDIHIEEYRNTILIKQRWKYNWLNEEGTSPWTYMEKKEFHHKCDKQIWGIWGNYYDLEAFGDSDFVKRNKNKLFHVNFDIEWVKSNQHWTVDAKKVNDPNAPFSRMCWAERKIWLTQQDYKKINIVRSYGAFDHVTVAHEFGHSIGNVPDFQNMHWDEYREESKYYYDKTSMMNLGMKLRYRHLDYVLAVLNMMILDTEFKHSDWF